MHKYIFMTGLLLLSGCTTSLIKSVNKKPAIEPIKQPVKTFDLDNDGVVSKHELDIVTDSPEPLSVFVWLIVAVLITVLITMVYSKKKEKKPETKGATPIYQQKTKIASKEQRDVIRG